MSHDTHFAELAKSLKHNCNIHGFTFKLVSDWYELHYHMSKNSKKYMPSIAHILVNYMERTQLITMPELVERVNPDYNFRHRFPDLTEDENNNYHTRIVAEICGKLLMTEVAKIPGYVR